MRITMEDYKWPYLMHRNHVFFLQFWWQPWPVFSYVWKQRDHISEFGIIVSGLWITVIHEWWDYENNK